MAKAKISGNRGLNFTAQLSIEEAKKNALELKRVLNDLGVSSPSTDGFASAQRALRTTMLNSQVEATRLREENLRLRNEYERGRITSQEYRTEITRINAARRQEAEAARLARRAQQEVSGSYAEAQARLKALRSEIISAENGYRKLSPELKAKIKEYKELNEGLKRFDASMGNHQRNVGDYRGAIKGAAGDLLGFATQYLSLGAALSFVFRKTLEFQKIKTPLTFILGSEGEANNKLAELKKMADELGVSYFTLANTYRSFTAAARASNFDLAKSEKIFASVTRASSVLGLSSEQLEGALLAVQQMISKGSVQSEELRGQLGERLPGAFSLAAKAMGVTEQELGKLLQTGQVVASDLLPKLADQLDKAYGDKAKEGIGGLNAELGRLQTALESTAGESSGLSKSIFEPIIIGAREAVKEIGQLFRGSFTENVKYLFTFSSKDLAAQRTVYDLRDARKNNSNAQKAAEEYSTEGKSLADLRTKYDQLTQTMRSAVNAQTKFKEGVKAGTIKETSDATVALYTSIANGIIAQRSRIGAAINDAKKNQVSANKEVLDSQLSGITEIRKRISELQKLSGSAIGGSDVANRIKALQDRLKSPSSSSSRSAESALNSQRALQAEIDALTKKGKAKQLSDDQQEIADIDAKYKKVLDKAIAFNNNKRNIEKGLKVNTSGILQAQSTEVDAKIDEQQAAKLKTTLSAEKKLYDEYEQYKDKIGEEGASKRFASQLNDSKSYLERLKQLEDDILNPEKQKGADGGGTVNTQQLAYIQEQIALETALQKKKNDDIFAYAYQSAQTYYQRAEEIERDYQVKRKALGKDATSDQLRNLAQERDDRIKSNNEANAYQLSGYSNLLENIDGLTRQKANEALDNAIKVYDDQYKSGFIKAKEYYDRVAELEGKKSEINKTENNPFAKIKNSVEAYRKQLNGVNKDSVATAEAQSKMFSAISEGAGAASDVIGSVAGSLSELGIGGEALQKSLGNVQGILEGAGSIAKGLASGNPVDIVTGSIKLLTAAIQLFNVKDKRLEKQIKGYKEQLASLGAAYKQLERDASNSVGESIYTDQAKQIENLRQQQVLLTRARETERNKKKSDQGKIDEFTNQIDAIPGQIEDIQKAISQNLIQTTFKDLSNSLADAFTEAFSSGESSAEKFGSVFNNVIANAIKNSLKLKILDPIVKKFTDDLTAYAQANNNSVIGFDFASYKEQLKQAGDLFTQGLKGSEEFFKGIGATSATSGSSTTGIVRSQLTEQTGSILEGLFRSQYEQTKLTNTILTPIGKSLGDIFVLTQAKFVELQAINANTFRTANNTDQLNTKLDAIIANTKPAVTARGAGI